MAGEVTSAPISPPARRLVQSVAVTAGRATARARMMPGFLIMGAQRCGTTSLYRTLAAHPAVLKPVLHKGVHYFDMNYGRGLRWYRGHFPSVMAQRRAERVSGSPVLTFESSPYYLFHPLAPARIASDLPAVKLVVLVRDPVERAHSAHAHELARGYETEPFERALELEPQRLAGERERMVADPSYASFDHQHHAYLARGRYADQLETLESLVGAGRVLVVDSGRFFGEPEKIYPTVLSFLGLGPQHDPPFEQHNARPRSDMASSLRTRLRAEFVADDERLERWLGETPSWRREDT